MICETLGVLVGGRGSMSVCCRVVLGRLLRFVVGPSRRRRSRRRCDVDGRSRLRKSAWGHSVFRA
jgi:hypothetical protein